MESFSTMVQALAGGRLLLWTGAVSICLFVMSYFTGQARKLRHIPTVGPTWPLLSFLGSIAFLKDSKKVLDDGTSKWPVFKVAGFLEWVVVMTEPKVIEEVMRAPESVLSQNMAVDEMIQTKYTVGPQTSENPFHVTILRAQLTRALPKLMPVVREEVVDSFNQYIPPTEDWTGVKLAEIATKVVTRASNRIFVGLPLCRNPDYVELNIEFTMDVFKAATIIRLFPSVMRPLVNRLVSIVPQRQRDGLKHLAPLFAERRKLREKKSADEEMPLDFVTWLMDEAKGQEIEDTFLTARVLSMNFGAIHTSSISFTHAFYYLAACPEYMAPLREEVEEVVRSEGWTKEALDQMHKLDSFVKESQRLQPILSLMMTRTTVNDYTFSNGITLPAGTLINVNTNSHFDEKVYEDPHTFDGFRFVKMQQRAEANGIAGRKFDMVSTSVSSLAFGAGRHACPGRFFASCEIKLMLAHIILTYDVKMGNEGVRPPNVLIAGNCLPDPNAKVLFRKRK